MVVIVNQTRANFLFLLIAVLGGVSNVCRSDYNLPLFVFIWCCYFNFPESKKCRQQKFIRRFILLSCIQDMLYILYWSPLWFSLQWKTNEPSTFGCHISTLVVSIANIVLKFLTLFILKGGTGFTSNQILVYSHY
ncbi:hypothetical protein FG379_002233 [Cryptosporidium bovis]|uniref:uncharacterized protein n=1 Tax=Cryptosporidium bovis TaxID=310047 RepID=UPI00351A232A|nr:hypothetical protein FG379_002233 [Cryptosporidium bovis]